MYRLIYIFCILSMTACAIPTATPTIVPQAVQSTQSETRAQVLYDTVEVRDSLMAHQRYVYLRDWVIVIGRQGNWCQLNDGNQIFCGCISGYNAGLGCR